MLMCLNTREREVSKMRKSEQTSPVSFQLESSKILDKFTTEILDQMSEKLWDEKSDLDY